ncbi:MAG: hypothetical protein K8S87_09015 [Planctomycetes bacterium]|nr:hypothetical protein [Planctomycetota bacterium]
MKPVVRNALLLSAIFFVACVTILFRFVLADTAKPEEAIKDGSEAVEDEILPIFYEFGSTVCKPCKMMKPVLADLKKNYKGILRVLFFDTNIDKNKIYFEKFNFKYIPTQVIVDADGVELARHTGFWALKDIELKLVQIGIITAEKLAEIKNPKANQPEKQTEEGLDETFFNNLESWILDNYLLGILAVFAWGVISVIFSPCQLSTIPLVIGYVGGYTDGGTGKAFKFSAAFVIGLFIPIFVFAVVLSEALNLLEKVGPYFIGALLVLMGLYLMEILVLSFKAPESKKEKRGSLGAFALGIVYSIFVTGPCTLAFMAPILGLVSTGEDRFYGITLIFVFSIAHCLPILAAGTATGWVQKLLSSTTMGKTTNVFRWVSGLIILLVGVYFLAIK